MAHQIAHPVLAIPCFGIFADYDGNAPDTSTLLFVATEELAKEVCEFLNSNTAASEALAWSDGNEWCKAWKYLEELVPVDKAGEVYTSLEALKASEDLADLEEDSEEEAE